jgi:hypothetical protein
VASGCLDAIDHFARRAEQDILNLPAGKTLIHGEPRVDNVLFEDLPGGPRAWLIDGSLPRLAARCLIWPTFYRGLWSLQTDARLKKA